MEAPGIWGFRPERVSCHPGWQKNTPPPAPLPAQGSHVLDTGEARSPPWDRNAGGGSSRGEDIPSGAGSVVAAAGPRLSYVP